MEKEIKITRETMLKNSMKTTDLKLQIEQLYTNSFYNNEAPNSFANKMLDLIGEDEQKLTRSKLQSRARWRYLTLVASVLNDNGESYKAKGIEMPLRWTKDLLYHIYWQNSRYVLFPEKKRQLDSSEFSKLADHIMELFSMIFDIHIPFPNFKDKLLEEDEKQNIV